MNGKLRDLSMALGLMMGSLGMWLSILSAPISNWARIPSLILLGIALISNIVLFITISISKQYNKGKRKVPKK